MNRVILTLGCVLFLSAEAFADCAEEATEAWRRLLKTPFSFELAPEDRSQSSVTGSFSWPSAMQFSFHGPGGKVQLIVVGPRGWSYSKAVWREAKLGSTSDALASYWYMFGFVMPPPIGKGMESAICLGRVVMEGRGYDVYEYSVRRSHMGESIDHQKLYVDVLSGLPARLKAELEGIDPYSKTLPRTRRSIEFTPDPLLKIEPPG